MLGGRYDPDTVKGNSSGGGIDISCRNHQIDIYVRNVAGVGVKLREMAPTGSNEFGLPMLNAHITECRHECLIIQGAGGDGKLGKVWCGLGGLFPISEVNDSAVSKASPTYGDVNGGRIDNIVIEDTNLEIETIHTWAAWFGCGFTTYGACRFTRGTVISESNNKQLDISAGTYGTLDFDLRNMGAYHPNWAQGAAIASNAMSDINLVPELFRYQADIKALASFTAFVNIRRIQIGSYHVPRTVAVHVPASARPNLKINHTAATGTSANSLHEIGAIFSGDVAIIEGDGSDYDITVDNSSGSVVLKCGRSKVDIKCSRGVRVPALIRDTLSNSGATASNTIRGSISDCAFGFQSIGNSQSEKIDLDIAFTTGQTPISGDMPTIDRDQSWRVNTFNRSTLERKTTDRFFALSDVLDASTLDAKTVTIPHRWAYVPSPALVQISTYDSATPSTAKLEYCVINNITATDVTVAYKFSEVDTTPAANMRIALRIG